VLKNWTFTLYRKFFILKLVFNLNIGTSTNIYVEGEYELDSHIMVGLNLCYV